MKKKFVYLVQANDDGIEGKGRWQFDKLFTTLKKARAYIKPRGGVMGQPQPKEPYNDILKSKKILGPRSESWNNFCITELELE